MAPEAPPKAKLDIIGTVMPRDEDGSTGEEKKQKYKVGWGKFLKSLLIWGVGTLASLAPALYLGFKEFVGNGSFPLMNIISGYELTYVCVAMIWAVLAEITWIELPQHKTAKRVCIISLGVSMAIGIFLYTISYDYASRFDELPDVAIRLMGANIIYLILVLIWVFAAYILTSMEEIA